MDDSWVKRRLRTLRAGSRNPYPSHQLTTFSSDGIGSARSTDGLFPRSDLDLSSMSPTTPSSCHPSNRHLRLQSYPPLGGSPASEFSARHRSRASLSTAVSTSLQQEMDPSATINYPRFRISEVDVPTSGEQSTRSSMSTIIPIDSPLEETLPNPFRESDSLHGRVLQSIPPVTRVTTNDSRGHDSVTLPTRPDPCLTSHAGAMTSHAFGHSSPSPVDNIDRFFDLPLNYLSPPSIEHGSGKLTDVAQANGLRTVSPGPSSH